MSGISSSRVYRKQEHAVQNRAMSGIQFVTDEKGRKVGVLIDLKNTEPA
jgi:hypothetical protein